MKGSFKKRWLLLGAAAFAAGLATAIWTLTFGEVLASPGLTARAPLERSQLGERSLYQLTSSWVTERGRTVELLELGGKFAIVAMIFTSCPSECPTLVKDLQALERTLPSALLAETRFVLISIDPERDTPEVLRQYAGRMGLDRTRWTLLRGRAEDVRELGAVLGVAYGKSGAAGGLVHSKLVTVLNRRGEVLHQQLSARDDPGRIVRAIAAEESR